MDNPQNLLKQAALEENDDIRLKKIVKACKIISESLPFEEIIELVVNKNKELIKYLFLSYIFSPNPVRLLLASLLEKFQCNLSFIKQFWDALEYCARLKEKNHDNEQMQNTNDSFHSESSEGETSKTNLKIKEIVQTSQFNKRNQQII